MAKRDIAFYIETEVQYYSLRPLLLYLRENTKILFDIIVPELVGFELGAGAAVKLIKKDSFAVARTTNHKYKVLLASYIYKNPPVVINARYKIMYAYGHNETMKADFLFNYLMNEGYLADAFMTYNSRMESVFDIFTKTYVVPNLKLTNFTKKKRTNKKPVVLFAPTYNDIVFAGGIADVAEDIKNNFRIIVMAHHRNNHISDNKKYFDRIAGLADEIYDSSFPMKTVLEKADVVLTDSSSLMFDSLSVGLPVGIFSGDPNKYHFRKIDTIQSKLIKDGIFPYTNDPTQIVEVLNQALSKAVVDKQERLKNEMFQNFKNPIGKWVEIINVYLREELPAEYSYAKEYWVDKINGLAQNGEENQELTVAIDELKASVAERDIEIASFLGVKRSARLLVGNIKRRIKRMIK